MELTRSTSAGPSAGSSTASGDLVKAEGLKRIAPSFFFSVNTVSQAAGKAAYSEAWYWAEAFLEHLQRLRDYACDRLSRMDGVRCLKPEGTYVMFPEISSFGLTSEEMAENLLR